MQVPVAAPQVSALTQRIQNLLAQKNALVVEMAAAKDLTERMKTSVDNLSAKTDTLRHVVGLKQEALDDMRDKLVKAEREALLRQQQLSHERRKLSDVENALEESNEVRAELGKAWETSEAEIRDLRLQLEDREAEVAVLRERLHPGNVKKEVRSDRTRPFLISLIPSRLPVRIRKPARHNPENVLVRRSSILTHRTESPVRRTRSGRPALQIRRARTRTGHASVELSKLYPLCLVFKLLHFVKLTLLAYLFSFSHQRPQA